MNLDLKFIRWSEFGALVLIGLLILESFHSLNYYKEASSICLSLFVGLVMFKSLKAEDIKFKYIRA